MGVEIEMRNTKNVHFAYAHTLPVTQRADKENIQKLRFCSLKHKESVA
jgi:hypothetical protein